MIVVLDSNVRISALLFGGMPSQALVRARVVDTLLLSSQIEDEVIRIMSSKFGSVREQVHDDMAAFLEGSIRVIVTGTITGICRDLKDDFVLECAALGHADLIVTGDKDLLSLASFQGIRIVTARQYLDSAPD